MIVIDASVGIKWLKQDEEHAKQALRVYKNHIEGKEKITVPSLFFLEVANVLAVTPNISDAVMRNSLQDLNNIGIVIHSFSKANLLEAAHLAKKHKTTVYDMLYAVVAKEQKCTLITADQQFLKKTRFPFVRLLQAL